MNNLSNWIDHLNTPRRTSRQELERRLNWLCIGDSCTTSDLCGLPEATITRLTTARLEVRQGDCVYLTNRRHRHIADAIDQVLAHFTGQSTLTVTIRQPIYDQPELL